MLDISNISLGFPNAKPILKGISMSLEKGNVYALMGSNGAGKTTLFNAITGFLKPQSGYIRLNKIKITARPPYAINRMGIGRTFQDLRIITQLTVTENILLAFKNNPTDKLINAVLPAFFYRNTNRQMMQKATEILHQFFLFEVKDTLANNLSYGQQKLLTLACCVANNATLLLLDEPVAGIQPEYRNKIALLIKQLKTEGKTILLIEHNTDFIATVADHIYFLHNGIILLYKDVESLQKDPQVLKAYI